MAPGTVGTVAALIPAFFILKYFGVQTLFLLCILIFVAAIPHINAYEKESEIHDDKHIVIDEVAGVFLALSIYGSTVFSFNFFRFIFKEYSSNDITSYKQLYNQHYQCRYCTTNI